MSIENTQTTAKNIDATGLTCPMPLVLLKKAIKEVSAGDCVKIEVTDVHAELDFEIWCERFGHSLEAVSCREGVYGFMIIKGERL